MSKEKGFSMPNFIRRHANASPDRKISLNTLPEEPLPEAGDFDPVMGELPLDNLVVPERKLLSGEALRRTHKEN